MKKNKTSLLIGVTGFIGYKLAHYLLAKNERVIGTYINPSEVKFDHRIKLIRCDVTNPNSISRIISLYKPDYIYYLAAQSSVRIAWMKTAETLNINLLGGVYLLEALKNKKSTAKTLFFSSGTTYGASHMGKQLDEESCLKPKDPYSVSKMGIDYLARLYANVHHLNIAVVRLANITGPGQSTIFSVGNFASQIVKIEKKQITPVLEVGNLSAKRDYLDIRDGVKALHLAMKLGKRGEAYNIASGKTISLNKVLSTLLRLSSYKGHIKIKKKNYLIPKDEIKEIRLDASKIRKLTRWEPKISTNQMLSDILDDWRKKINQS